MGVQVIRHRRWPLGARGERPVRFDLEHVSPDVRDLVFEIPGTMRCWTNNKPQVAVGWDGAWIVANLLNVPSPAPPLTMSEADVAAKPGLKRFQELFAPTMARYQLEGVLFLAPRAWAGLFDEMRLRKSQTTLGAITLNALPGPGLIICPARFKNGWANEIARWLNEPSVVLHGRGADACDVRVPYEPQGGVRRSVCKTHLTTRDLRVSLTREGGASFAPWPLTTTSFRCTRHPDIRGARPVQCKQCRAIVHDTIVQHRWVIIGHELLYAQPEKDAAGGEFERDDLPGWTEFITKRLRPRFVIWDEAHCVTNVSTDRTKAGRTLYDQLLKVTEEPEVVYALTGTPTNGYTKSWFPMLNIISKGTATGNSKRTQFVFQKRYCDAHHEEIELNDGTVRKHWVIKGSTELAHTEFTERRRYYSLQRFKRDVASELPAKVREIVIVDAPEDELRREMRLIRSKTKGVQKNDQLRRMTAKIKLPQLIDNVIGQMLAGNKVIVGSFNPDTGKLVDEALRKAVSAPSRRAAMNEVNVKLISTIGLDPRKADDMQLAFREHAGACCYNCTIYQTQTGSLRGASFIHELDFIDDPAKLRQFEERANEIGTTGLTIQHYAVEGTVDVVLAEKLMPKLDLLEQQTGDKAASEISQSFGEIVKPISYDELEAAMLERFHAFGSDVSDEDDPEWRD